jgi:hypothetical protein
MSLDVPMTAPERHAFILRAAFGFSLALCALDYPGGEHVRACARLFDLDDPAGEELLFQAALRATTQLRHAHTGVSTIGKALTRALADFALDAPAEWGNLEDAEERATVDVGRYLAATRGAA